MEFTRRGFLAAAAATGAAYPALAGESKRKKHIVTLGFDDGFKKSSIKTAAIYEKYKLSACLNIVASARQRLRISPTGLPNTASAISACGTNSTPEVMRSCPTATSTPTRHDFHLPRRKT